MKYSFFSFILWVGILLGAAAQDSEPKTRLHSLEVFPVGEINLVQYARMLSSQDEVVTGIIWYDPQVMGVLKYPGSQRVLAGEAGYRRYLWQGLHLEAQILPQVHFLQEEGKTQVSLAGVLAAEVRLGYRWEFTLGDLCLFLNPQFFSGFYLADGRPEGFIQADRNRGLHPLYLSPVPMIFLGLRF